MLRVIRFFNELTFSVLSVSSVPLSKHRVGLRMHRFYAWAAGAVTLLAWPCEASTLTPPVLPLFVRNPYLSTWLQNARDEPWERWPMFWTGQEVRVLRPYDPRPKSFRSSYFVCADLQC